MKIFALLLWLTMAPASILAADPAAPVRQKSSIREVSIDEAAKLASQTNVLVLDVRTPKEFRDGRIRGATNLNFYEQDFQTKLKPLDKGRPTLVYCAVGGRSAKTIRIMQGLGFTNILHLSAGMSGWEKAGKPVER